MLLIQIQNLDLNPDHDQKSWIHCWFIADVHTKFQIHTDFFELCWHENNRSNLYWKKSSKRSSSKESASQKYSKQQDVEVLSSNHGYSQEDGWMDGPLDGGIVTLWLSVVTERSWEETINWGLMMSSWYCCWSLSHWGWWWWKEWRSEGVKEEFLCRCKIEHHQHSSHVWLWQQESM